MSHLMQFWRSEVARNVIVIPWLMVFAINCCLNYAMGLETAHGWVRFAYAAGFVAIALLGAWAAWRQQFEIGTKRTVLLLLVACQLYLGQNAGWQALGLTLGKGQAKLEDQAAKRRSTIADRRRAESELAAIVARLKEERVTTDVQGAELARKRECATGEGPRCERKTAIVGMLKRKDALERHLPTLRAEAASGPKIKDPTVLTQVPVFLANWLAQAAAEPGTDIDPVTPEDVHFAWLVFIVALLEFVATCGAWLFGIGGPPRRPEPQAIGVGAEPKFAHPDPHDPYGVYALPAPPRHEILTSGGGGDAGGATNIINIGPGGERLPPRLAARR